MCNGWGRLKEGAVGVHGGCGELWRLWEPWDRGEIHGGSLRPVGSMVVSGGPWWDQRGPGSVGSSRRLLGTIGVYGGRGGLCRAMGSWGAVAVGKGRFCRALAYRPRESGGLEYPSCPQHLRLPACRLSLHALPAWLVTA